ncbi:unnamed protein product [Prorocentrum cordatum]|uniref:Alkaline phosphatase n=1 Tax=Prorocentrum cordatum TaxID=2364126 RepID=A0ABN9X1K9_9DINO|nr:unnamed protein product [Polarella glacialis]
MTLAAFLALLALDCVDAATGRAVMAAIRHLLLAPGPARAALPRACKALGCWERPRPPCSRWPMPRPMVMVIDGVMLSPGQLPLAWPVILLGAGFPRPSGACRLRGAPPVAPNTLAGLRRGGRGSGAGPSEVGRLGMASFVDESDAPRLPARGPPRASPRMALPGGAPTGCFEATGVRDAFDAAAEHLGLEAQQSRYVLHRSVAGDYLLAPGRSLAEVKDRGRWWAEGSLRRYAKRTELQWPRSEKDLAFGQNADLLPASLFGGATIQQVRPWAVPPMATASSRGRQRPALPAKWAGI